MVVGQSELGWVRSEQLDESILVCFLFFFFLLLNSKLLQTQQPKRALSYHLTVFEGQQAKRGLAGSFAKRLLTSCKSSARAGVLLEGLSGERALTKSRLLAGFSYLRAARLRASVSSWLLARGCSFRSCHMGLPSIALWLIKASKRSSLLAKQNSQSYLN